MVDGLEQRLSRIEAELARLRDRVEDAPQPSSQQGDFWALDGLRDRHPDGAVLLTGSLEVPGTGPVGWQYALTAEALLDQDWSELAGTIDALAHPVRLRLLQLVLSGVRTTAELAAQEDLGTTGQLHHHLRALIGGGWLASAARGRYEVPAGRVVPLLAVLLATRPT